MSTTICPILSLPAELRNQIYQYALFPTGALTLLSTKTTRYAVEPRISPALLATCRQIHHEARDLLATENSIILTVDAHETYWPLISEKRLPQRVLGNIRHLCVVFDCTAVFHGRYGEVDFGPFGALGRLRTLRVGGLAARRGGWRRGEGWGKEGEGLMREVLVRVSGDVEVLCGVQEGSQEGKLLEAVLKERRRAWRGPGAVWRVKGEEIEEAVDRVPEGVRGVKSGGDGDVFERYRELQMVWGSRFAVT